MQSNIVKGQGCSFFVMEPNNLALSCMRFVCVFVRVALSFPTLVNTVYQLLTATNHSGTIRTMDPTPAAPVISTVAELNHILKKTPVPAHLLRKLTFVEQRLLQKSRVLSRLIYIKYLYGSQPSTEEHFCKARQAYHEIDSRVHLNQYSRMFGEINEDAGSPFGPGRVQRFLDLGCSPGGFSEWLLANNPGATGTGVTLSDVEARWVMNIRDTLLEDHRYDLRFDDVIRLAMTEVSSVSPVVDGSPVNLPSLSHSAFGTQSFDLIIAGAFPTLTGGVRIAYRAQLILSQIYFILRHLTVGGERRRSDQHENVPVDHRGYWYLATVLRKYPDWQRTFVTCNPVVLLPRLRGFHSYSSRQGAFDGGSHLCTFLASNPAGSSDEGPWRREGKRGGGGGRARRRRRK